MSITRFKAPLFDNPISIYIALILSKRRLNRHLDCDESVNDVLGTISRDKWNIPDADKYEGYGAFKSIEAAQDPKELRRLLTILDGHSPDSIIEIGTGYGGTIYAWAQWLSPNYIVNVDFPRNVFDFVGGWPNAKKPLFDYIGERNDVEIKHVRGDSQKKSTKAEVIDEMNGEQVDFLFIDADHSLEGVRNDWSLYSPLVREGGIVAIHDIATGDYNPEWGVETFWNEDIKPSYETDELVSDKTEGFGTGIVYL